MRVLLHGLHFSPYALLREVVENEFADEVAESGREAFCNGSFIPTLTNLFAGYDTSDDTFALSPDTTCSTRSWWEPSCFIWSPMAFNRKQKMRDNIEAVRTAFTLDREGAHPPRGNVR